MALTWRGYFNVHWNICRHPSPLFVAFQVQKLPSGPCRGPESSVAPPNLPVMSRVEFQQEQPHGLQPQLRPLPQSCFPSHQQQQPGPSSRAAEPAAVHSHRGSPLHLSAHSACSSSSLPGRGPMLKPPPPRLCHSGEKMSPLMSQALGGEEWQASVTALLLRGEGAAGQGWAQSIFPQF